MLLGCWVGRLEVRLHRRSDADAGIAQAADSHGVKMPQRRDAGMRSRVEEWRSAVPLAIAEDAA